MCAGFLPSVGENTPNTPPTATHHHTASLASILPLVMRRFVATSHFVPAPGTEGFGAGRNECGGCPPSTPQPARGTVSLPPSHGAVGYTPSTGRPPRPWRRGLPRGLGTIEEVTLSSMVAWMFFRRTLFSDTIGTLLNSSDLGKIELFLKICF